jgi:hypothetical protein
VPDDFHVNPQRSVPLLLTLGLGVVAAGWGCQRSSRVGECSSLVTRLNGSLAAIEASSKGWSATDKDAIAEMRTLAARYDELAAEVGKLALKDQRLAAFAVDYRGMATSAAGTARKMAEAIEAKDLASATTAQATFNDIVKREDELVARINDFCQAP